MAQDGASETLAQLIFGFGVTICDAVTSQRLGVRSTQANGGLIYPKARIEELFRIFETDQVGVVFDQDKIVGIVSKIDVLDYMSSSRKP